MGVAESDVIGYARGGATANVKFISFVIPAKHNNLAKNNSKMSLM